MALVSENSGSVPTAAEDISGEPKTAGKREADARATVLVIISLLDCCCTVLELTSSSSLLSPFDCAMLVVDSFLRLDVVDSKPVVVDEIEAVGIVKPSTKRIAKIAAHIPANNNGV